MADAHGKHVWFEICTPDLDAAKAFYSQVLDWEIRDAGMPGMTYLMGGPPGHAVAGMMAMTPEMVQGGAVPAWTGYVAVHDVDADAERAKALGGTVCMPPTDIPGVGRFAVVADPQGAVFALFQGTPGEEPPPPPAPGTPGQIGWHELHTGELNAALGFYQALFGWRKEETLDMGPNGPYQLFGTSAMAQGADGGMANLVPPGPQPYWLYYVNVADVDRALARTTAGGGQVLHGPHQVPGGGWILLARDPQGIVFAVVGPRGSA